MGQWFAYSERDEDDLHYAQTDFIVLGFRRGLVVETKITRTPDGIIQLLALYQPIVRSVWPNIEWSFCQAFKFWAGPPFEGSPVFTSIEEALGGKYLYGDLHLDG